MQGEDIAPQDPGKYADKQGRVFDGMWSTTQDAQGNHETSQNLIVCNPFVGLEHSLPYGGGGVLLFAPLSEQRAMLL